MGRPMTAGVHIEVCPRRIRAVFHGKTIADSSGASLVWRTGWPPVPWYYFPKDDIDSQIRTSSLRTTLTDGLKP